VARTQRWAQRCLDEHVRLTAERDGVPVGSGGTGGTVGTVLTVPAGTVRTVPTVPPTGTPPTARPYQALFGVVQGAQYEDLRRLACRGLAATCGPGGDRAQGAGFDGYGIGGALEKSMIGTIVGWCAEELPDDKPRHLLGISEPEDLFAAVGAGADTFDCVNPSRTARNAAIYTATGRYNVTNARFRRDFGPLEDGCDCLTCRTTTRAYLHHLFHAHELNAYTLATIHNERFTIRLVDDMRVAIADGAFDDFRDSWLARWARR